MEEKMATIENQKDYTFDILLQSWMLSPFSDGYKNMTTIILLDSLVPPSTAEDETNLRPTKLLPTSSHCMRICKFRDLRADEYEQILRCG